MIILFLFLNSPLRCDIFKLNKNIKFGYKALTISFYETEDLPYPKQPD